MGGRCEDSAALQLQSEPNSSSPAPSRSEIAIATYMHVFESITGLKYECDVSTSPAAEHLYALMRNVQAALILGLSVRHSLFPSHTNTSRMCQLPCRAETPNAKSIVLSLPSGDVSTTTHTSTQGSRWFCCRSCRYTHLKT